MYGNQKKTLRNTLSIEGSDVDLSYDRRGDLMFYIYVQAVTFNLV